MQTDRLEQQFLPSEICRLVLGFLKEGHYMNTYKCFLRECVHLREYESLLRSGQEYPTNIMGYSLVMMLKEYAILKLAAGGSVRMPPASQVSTSTALTDTKVRKSNLTSARHSQSIRTKRFLRNKNGLPSRASNQMRHEQVNASQNVTSTSVNQVSVLSDSSVESDVEIEVLDKDSPTPCPRTPAVGSNRSVGGVSKAQATAVTVGNMLVRGPQPGTSAQSEDSVWIRCYESGAASNTSRHFGNLLPQSDLSKQQNPRSAMEVGLTPGDGSSTLKSTEPLVADVTAYWPRAQKNFLAVGGKGVEGEQGDGNLIVSDTVQSQGVGRGASPSSLSVRKDGSCSIGAGTTSLEQTRSPVNDKVSSPQGSSGKPSTLQVLTDSEQSSSSQTVEVDIGRSVDQPSREASKRRKNPPRRRSEPQGGMSAAGPSSDENPLNKIINSSRFVKTLVDNINNCLYDSQKHQSPPETAAVTKATAAEEETDPCHGQTIAENQCVPLTLATESSSKEDNSFEELDFLNKDMSEDTVSNIINMTRNDPVLEELFKIFNADREEFIQREFGEASASKWNQKGESSSTRDGLHTPPPCQTSETFYPLTSLTSSGLSEQSVMQSVSSFYPLTSLTTSGLSEQSVMQSVSSSSAPSHPATLTFSTECLDLHSMSGFPIISDFSDDQGVAASGSLHQTSDSAVAVESHRNTGHSSAKEMTEVLSSEADGCCNLPKYTESVSSEAEALPGSLVKYNEHDLIQKCMEQDNGSTVKDCTSECGTAGKHPESTYTHLPRMGDGQQPAIGQSDQCFRPALELQVVSQESLISSQAAVLRTEIDPSPGQKVPEAAETGGKEQASRQPQDHHTEPCEEVSLQAEQCSVFLTDTGSAQNTSTLHSSDVCMAASGNTGHVQVASNSMGMQISCKTTTGSINHNSSGLMTENCAISISIQNETVQNTGVGLQRETLQNTGATIQNEMVQKLAVCSDGGTVQNEMVQKLAVCSDGVWEERTSCLPLACDDGQKFVAETAEKEEGDSCMSQTAEKQTGDSCMSQTAEKQTGDSCMSQAVEKQTGDSCMSQTVEKQTGDSCMSQTGTSPAHVLSEEDKPERDVRRVECVDQGVELGTVSSVCYRPDAGKILCDHPSTVDMNTAMNSSKQEATIHDEHNYCHSRDVLQGRTDVDMTSESSSSSSLSSSIAGSHQLHTCTAESSQTSAVGGLDFYECLEPAGHDSDRFFDGTRNGAIVIGDDPSCWVEVRGQKLGHICAEAAVSNPCVAGDGSGERTVCLTSFSGGNFSSQRPQLSSESPQSVFQNTVLENTGFENAVPRLQFPPDTCILYPGSQNQFAEQSEALSTYSKPCELPPDLPAATGDGTPTVSRLYAIDVQSSAKSPRILQQAQLSCAESVSVQEQSSAVQLTTQPESPSSPETQRALTSSAGSFVSQHTQQLPVITSSHQRIQGPCVESENSAHQDSPEKAALSACHLSSSCAQAIESAQLHSGQRVGASGLLVTSVAQVKGTPVVQERCPSFSSHGETGEETRTLPLTVDGRECSTSHGDCAVLSSPDDRTSDHSHDTMLSSPDNRTSDHSHDAVLSSPDDRTSDHSHDTALSSPDDRTSDHSHGAVLSSPDDRTSDHSHGAVLSSPDDRASDHSHGAVLSSPDDRTSDHSHDTVLSRIPAHCTPDRISQGPDSPEISPHFPCSHQDGGDGQIVERDHGNFPVPSQHSTRPAEAHGLNSDEAHGLNSDEAHGLNSDEAHGLNSDEAHGLNSDEAHGLNSDEAHGQLLTSAYSCHRDKLSPVCSERSRCYVTDQCADDENIHENDGVSTVCHSALQKPVASSPPICDTHILQSPSTPVGNTHLCQSPSTPICNTHISQSPSTPVGNTYLSQSPSTPVGNTHLSQSPSTPVGNTYLSQSPSTPVGNTHLSQSPSTPICNTHISQSPSTPVGNTYLSQSPSTPVGNTHLSQSPSTPVGNTHLSQSPSTPVGNTYLSQSPSTPVGNTYLSQSPSTPVGNTHLSQSPSTPVGNTYLSQSPSTPVGNTYLSQSPSTPVGNTHLSQSPSTPTPSNASTTRPDPYWTPQTLPGVFQKGAPCTPSRPVHRPSFYSPIKSPYSPRTAAAVNSLLSPRRKRLINEPVPEAVIEELSRNSDSDATDVGLISSFTKAEEKSCARLENSPAVPDRHPTTADTLCVSVPSSENPAVRSCSPHSVHSVRETSCDGLEENSASCSEVSPRPHDILQGQSGHTEMVFSTQRGHQHSHVQDSQLFFKMDEHSLTSIISGRLDEQSSQSCSADFVKSSLAKGDANTSADPGRLEERVDSSDIYYMRRPSGDEVAGVGNQLGKDMTVAAASDNAEERCVDSYSGPTSGVSGHIAHLSHGSQQRPVAGREEGPVSVQSELESRHGRLINVGNMIMTVEESARRSASIFSTHVTLQTQSLNPGADSEKELSSSDIFISEGISEETCKTNISMPILPLPVTQFLNSQIEMGELHVPEDFTNDLSPPKTSGTRLRKKTSRKCSPKKLSRKRPLSAHLSMSIGQFASLSKRRREGSPKKAVDLEMSNKSGGPDTQSQRECEVSEGCHQPSVSISGQNSPQPVQVHTGDSSRILRKRKTLNAKNTDANRKSEIQQENQSSKKKTASKTNNIKMTKTKAKRYNSVPALSDSDNFSVHTCSESSGDFSSDDDLPLKEIIRKEALKRQACLVSSVEMEQSGISEEHQKTFSSELERSFCSEFQVKSRKTGESAVNMDTAKEDGRTCEENVGAVKNTLWAQRSATSSEHPVSLSMRSEDKTLPLKKRPMGGKTFNWTFGSGDAEDKHLVGTRTQSLTEPAVSTVSSKSMTGKAPGESDSESSDEHVIERQYMKMSSGSSAEVDICELSEEDVCLSQDELHPVPQSVRKKQAIIAAKKSALEGKGVVQVKTKNKPKKGKVGEQGSSQKWRACPSAPRTRRSKKCRAETDTRTGGGRNRKNRTTDTAASRKPTETVVGTIAREKQTHSPSPSTEKSHSNDACPSTHTSHHRCPPRARNPSAEPGDVPTCATQLTSSDTAPVTTSTASNTTQVSGCGLGQQNQTFCYTAVQQPEVVGVQTYGPFRRITPTLISKRTTSYFPSLRSDGSGTRHCVFDTDSMTASASAVFSTSSPARPVTETSPGIFSLTHCSRSCPSTASGPVESSITPPLIDSPVSKSSAKSSIGNRTSGCKNRTPAMEGTIAPVSSVQAVDSSVHRSTGRKNFKSTVEKRSRCKNKSVTSLCAADDGCTVYPQYSSVFMQKSSKHLPSKVDIGEQHMPGKGLSAGKRSYVKKKTSTKSRSAVVKVLVDCVRSDGAAGKTAVTKKTSREKRSSIPQQSLGSVSRGKDTKGKEKQQARGSVNTDHSVSRGKDTKGKEKQQAGESVNTDHSVSRGKDTKGKEKQQARGSVNTDHSVSSVNTDHSVSRGKDTKGKEKRQTGESVNTDHSVSSVNTDHSVSSVNTDHSVSRGKDTKGKEKRQTGESVNTDHSVSRGKDTKGKEKQQARGSVNTDHSVSRGKDTKGKEKQQARGSVNTDHSVSRGKDTKGKEKQQARGSVNTDHSVSSVNTGSSVGRANTDCSVSSVNTGSSVSSVNTDCLQVSPVSDPSPLWHGSDNIHISHPQSSRDELAMHTSHVQNVEMQWMANNSQISNSAETAEAVRVLVELGSSGPDGPDQTVPLCCGHKEESCRERSRYQEDGMETQQRLADEPKCRIFEVSTELPAGDGEMKVKESVPGCSDRVDSCLSLHTADRCLPGCSDRVDSCLSLHTADRCLPGCSDRVDSCLSLHTADRCLPGCSDRVDSCLSLHTADRCLPGCSDRVDSCLSLHTANRCLPGCSDRVDSCLSLHTADSGCRTKQHNCNTEVMDATSSDLESRQPNTIVSLENRPLLAENTLLSKKRKVPSVWEQMTPAKQARLSGNRHSPLGVTGSVFGSHSKDDEDSVYRGVLNNTETIQRSRPLLSVPALGDVMTSARTVVSASEDVSVQEPCSTIHIVEQSSSDEKEKVVQVSDSQNRPVSTSVQKSGCIIDDGSIVNKFSALLKQVELEQDCAVSTCEMTSTSVILSENVQKNSDSFGTEIRSEGNEVRLVEESPRHSQQVQNVAIVNLSTYSLSQNFQQVGLPHLSTQSQQQLKYVMSPSRGPLQLVQHSPALTHREISGDPALPHDGRPHSSDQQSQYVHLNYLLSRTYRSILPKGGTRKVCPAPAGKKVSSYQPILPKTDLSYSMSSLTDTAHTSVGVSSPCVSSVSEGSSTVHPLHSAVQTVHPLPSAVQTVCPQLAPGQFTSSSTVHLSTPDSHTAEQTARTAGVDTDAGCTPKQLAAVEGWTSAASFADLKSPQPLVIDTSGMDVSPQAEGKMRRRKASSCRGKQRTDQKGGSTKCPDKQPSASQKNVQAAKQLVEDLDATPCNINPTQLNMSVQKGDFEGIAHVHDEVTQVQPSQTKCPPQETLAATQQACRATVEPFVRVLSLEAGSENEASLPDCEDVTSLERVSASSQITGSEQTAPCTPQYTSPHCSHHAPSSQAGVSQTAEACFPEQTIFSMASSQRLSEDSVAVSESGQHHTGNQSAVRSSVSSSVISPQALSRPVSESPQPAKQGLPSDQSISQAQNLLYQSGVSPDRPATQDVQDLVPCQKSVKTVVSDFAVLPPEPTSTNQIACMVSANQTAACMVSANQTAACMVSVSHTAACMAPANQTAAGLVSANQKAADLVSANQTAADLVSANQTAAGMVSAKPVEPKVAEFARPAAVPRRPKAARQASARPAVPSQTSSVPSQTSARPAVPSKTSAVPSQTPAVPSKTSAVPSQTSAKPAVPSQTSAKPAVPSKTSAVPSQTPAVTSQTSAKPAVPSQTPVPSQTSAVPSQTPAVPSQTSVPSQTPAVPSQTPVPSQTSAECSMDPAGSHGTATTPVLGSGNKRSEKATRLKKINIDRFLQTKVHK